MTLTEYLAEHTGDEWLDTREWCDEIGPPGMPYVPLLESILYRHNEGETPDTIEPEVVEITTVLTPSGHTEVWIGFGSPTVDPVETYSYPAIEDALWAHVALARYVTPRIPLDPPRRDDLLRRGRSLRDDLDSEFFEIARRNVEIEDDEVAQVERTGRFEVSR